MVESRHRLLIQDSWGHIVTDLCRLKGCWLLLAVFNLNTVTIFKDATKAEDDLRLPRQYVFFLKCPLKTWDLLDKLFPSFEKTEA